jgi:hypothetical protein
VFILPPIVHVAPFSAHHESPTWISPRAFRNTVARRVALFTADPVPMGLTLVGFICSVASDWDFER